MSGGKATSITTEYTLKLDVDPVAGTAKVYKDGSELGTVEIKGNKTTPTGIALYSEKNSALLVDNITIKKTEE